MKNIKKTLAGLLALSLIVGGSGQAFASENTEKENSSIFEILTTNEQANLKTDENKDLESYQNDLAYKEEFDSRYNLYERIILAKEMGNIDINGFVDILNKKAATKEDLEKAQAEINKLIDESDAKIALDLDIDSLKTDVRDYILYGKLFFNNTIDKTDIKNLYLFYEATVNSYTYTKGSDQVKKDLNPVLEEIYNYILGIDKKVEEKIEITEDDKKKTAEEFEKLDKLIDEKSSGILKLESTSLEKKAYLSSANEASEEEINVNSAFFKSERPGIKEAYQNLSAQQRQFIDSINQNNDDYITEEEIKADGQYSLPLEGNSEFIKPFFGNPEEGKETEKKAEITSTEAEGQKSTIQESQSTTPQNPQGDKPETVTISQGSNTVGTEDKKEEEKPSTYTKAASQVKTGIEGVGYLGIVLIVALAAYFVMLKKKKEDKEDK